MTESNGLQEVSVEMGRKGKWQLFYICNYGTEEFHSFYGVISRDDNGRALPNPYVSVLALKARASMVGYSASRTPLPFRFISAKDRTFRKVDVPQ